MLSMKQTYKSDTYFKAQLLRLYISIIFFFYIQRIILKRINNHQNESRVQYLGPREIFTSLFNTNRRIREIINVYSDL